MARETIHVEKLTIGRMRVRVEGVPPGLMVAVHGRDQARGRRRAGCRRRSRTPAAMCWIRPWMA